MSKDKVQFRESTQAACEEHEILEPTKQHNWHLTGWRFGAFVGVVSATLVLITNVGALVGTITRQSAKDDGRIPLYEGSCSKVRKLNIGIHLAINVLSTILLGASNYCMQCASAPTREEVDKAHKAKKWLDIGVLSRRNLLLISKKRVVLWILLAVSSLPLHLLLVLVRILEVTRAIANNCPTKL